MSDADARPKKKKSSARLLVIITLIGLLVIVASIAAIASLVPGAPKVEAGSALEIRLAGEMAESPSDPLLAAFGQGGGMSLWDLRRGLRAAADDPNIAGVIVEVGDVSMSFAAVEELLSEFDRFRESGKPVHAVIRADMLEEGELLVSLGADRIWMNPETIPLLNGLLAQVTFWRGTLDKLHIVPDVLMFHEYKSAGEPWQNTEMSEPMREALTAVLTDIQARMDAIVTERRNIDQAAWSAFLARGVQSPAEVLDAGLVDELGYLDQARAAVVGEGEYHGVSLSKYLKRAKDDTEAEHRIAVVFGEGPIAAAESDSPFGSDGIQGPKVAADIRAAAEDEDVDAIVFRVNSPGGSAVGSDLIWREIERAQEAGKPVVVSMSGVAGSGGYWISMGADAIVAHPSTITGSIGVVFSKFNLSGFYEWIGANVQTLPTSEGADIMSFYRNLDEGQRAALTASIGSMYDDFVRKVAEGRGLDEARVREIAKGRIWSGTAALDNGLIDKLGGLDDAVDIAKEKAGITGDVDLVIYPAPKPFFEQIMEELSAGMPEEPSIADLERQVQSMARPRPMVLAPTIVVE